MDKDKIQSFSLPLNYETILSEDPFITVVDIDLMHTGLNRNQSIITKESIERSIDSFYNKPLICLLNTMEMKSLSSDFTTHAENDEERDEYIVAGTIPMPEFSKPHFYVDDDGYERFKMRCVIWSFYRDNILRILEAKDGKTKVSVEIIPTEYHYDSMSNLVIDEFNFLGVAFLGEAVSEGMAGSKLEIVNFSYDEMINKTKDYLFYFALENNDYDPEVDYMDFTAKELKTRPAIKVNKSIDAISEDNWSTVDKKVLRYDVMRANNYITIAKDVFLQLNVGWDNGEVSKLKYPVMQIKDEILVYNRHGLQSAKRMAEKYNDIEVLKKLKAIYDDLHIEFKVKEDKPKIMFKDEENKKFESETDAVEDKEIKDEEFETKDEKIEDKEVKDEEFADGKEFETEPEKIEDKEIKDEEFEAKIDCDKKLDCDEDEDDKEGDNDDEEDIKEMSSDAFVDAPAQAEMLEDEAEDNKEEADEYNKALELWKLEKEAYESKIQNYESKIQEYETKINNFEEAKKQTIVENTLVGFEGKLSEEKIAEFTEKSKEYNCENINIWVNEVKAFAFDNAVEQPIKTFAFGTATSEVKSSTGTNVIWDKYTNK